MSKIQKNDLFYVCSLIESVSRNTGLLKKDIVDKIGKRGIKHLYDYASVNHSLPMAQVTDEIIEDCGFVYIENDKKYKTTVWDKGKIYQRLIVDISEDDNWLDSLFKVYHSFICKYIEMKMSQYIGKTEVI